MADRRLSSVRPAAALVVLISLLGAVSFAEAANDSARQTAWGSFERLALFDLESPRHSLELELRHRKYAGGPHADVLATLTKNPSRLDAAESVIARYLSAAKSGDAELAKKLYEPGDPAAEGGIKMLPFVASHLEDGRRAELVERVAFGRYEMFFLRFHGDSKAKSLALSVRREEDRFYRDDEWRGAPDVLRLLWYLSSRRMKGLGSLHEPREMHCAIEVAPGKKRGNPAKWNSMVVRFDGRWFDSVDKWASPDRIASSTPAADCVHRFLSAAGAGTNAEYLDFWAGEERQRLAEALRRSEREFSVLRGVYSAQSPIRDVLTMDLGDYAVHYYSEEARPNRLRSLILEKRGDSFALTEDLYSNVKKFLESERWKRHVALAWKERTAATDKEESGSREESHSR